MDAKTVNVFCEGKRAGTLKLENGINFSFTYAQEWLDSETFYPLSCSLPLSNSSHEGKGVQAFFENLLPDSIHTRGSIARVVDAGGDDCVSLLSAIGRDCAGAVTFSREDAIAGKLFQKISGTKLNKKDFAEFLDYIRYHSLGISRENDIRVAIAGTQTKGALLKIRHNWFQPEGYTPTTHILKLPIPRSFCFDLSSVENEYLCLKVCKHLGLPVPKCEIVHAEDSKAFVIERFDRKWTKEGILERVHAEDLCQALGVMPCKKYQSDGGLGIKEVMALLEKSLNPEKDRELFMRSQVIFFLLGAIDGHAKNFSILHTREGFFLSPFYDVLSIFVGMFSLEAKLAMSLGDSHLYRLSEISYRHFEQTAKSTGFSVQKLKKIISDLKDRIRTMETVMNEAPKDFPSEVAEGIFEGVRSQAKILGSR